MSESKKKIKNSDGLPTDIVSRTNETKSFGKASRTLFYNTDATLRSISYDFEAIVPKGFQSKVLFDAQGNVIHPIKSADINGRLRVLPTAKLSVQMDYETEFATHTGKDIHLYMPQGKEMFGIEHYIIRRFFERDQIRPVLIHGPGVDVLHRDFLAGIAFMRGNYGVDTITLHPLRGDYSTARAKLEGYHDDIKAMGVKLAYENMDARDRWFTFPQEIVDLNLENIGLTLDTSHLPADTDLSALLDQVFDKLMVVHLSNQSRGNKHLPYRNGDMNLSALVSQLKSYGFKGNVVLEYMPQYNEQLNDDTKRLQDILE